MGVKLLTEHHLEFLSLKGGCTGSSESTLVKMPHCWKSHVTAHFMNELMFKRYTAESVQNSRTFTVVNGETFYGHKILGNHFNIIN